MLLLFLYNNIGYILNISGPIHPHGMLFAFVGKHIIIIIIIDNIDFKLPSLLDKCIVREGATLAL